MKRLTLLICASMLLFSAVGCTSGTDSQWLNYYEKAKTDGLRQYKEGQYVDAAASFKNALRFYTTEYKLYYYLGSSYENLGQLDQAIVAYKSSIDIQDVTIQGMDDEGFRLKTMDALATLLAQHDDRGVQRENLARYSEEKKNPRGFMVLAKANRLAGDADAALDMYNKAVKLDPKSFYIKKEFGLYLAQIGQTQRALVYLREARESKSTDAEVNSAIAALESGPAAAPSGIQPRD